MAGAVHDVETIRWAQPDRAKVVATILVMSTVGTAGVVAFVLVYASELWPWVAFGSVASTLLLGAVTMSMARSTVVGVDRISGPGAAVKYEDIKSFQWSYQNYRSSPDSKGWLLTVIAYTTIGWMPSWTCTFQVPDEHKEAVDVLARRRISEAREKRRARNG